MTSELVLLSQGKLALGLNLTALPGVSQTGLRDEVGQTGQAFNEIIALLTDNPNEHT